MKKDIHIDDRPRRGEFDNDMLGRRMFFMSLREWCIVRGLCVSCRKRPAVEGIQLCRDCRKRYAWKPKP